MPFELKQTLENQNYHLVGNHSGVKLCHWTKHDIKGAGSCYKDKFYGITSYQCMQVSPALTWCTERCTFCWRSESYAMGDDMSNIEHEDPREVVLGMIIGQKKLMSGYGGHKQVPREKWIKANTPKHVAISLSGEPTLYKHLDEFIGICHEMGMSTFLVTNGTQPQVLADLENLPTQLYLTLAAASPRVHSAITRPFNPKKAWNSLMETIDLFPSLDTRKVVRMTLVKGKNMVEPEKYAELFLRAEAHFFEAKGFVSVGDARQNLGFEQMPALDDIIKFSQEICNSATEHLEVIDFSGSSCCVLMAKEDYSWRK
ncbi:MAG: 4-demethylwyosine synthase TYW1, partial [Candidatus Heimdallarchaeota archaeon]|nr:4-demethylwyosine synthase TYW1 [Candidatus Heimdallarchaeota archaeon]